MRSAIHRIASAIAPAWYNKKFCGRENLWNEYFIAAEADMDEEWKNFIWPNIRDFDFSIVLELAPGAGRNTEKLAAISKKLYAVDYNVYALKKAKERFHSYTGPCSLSFHQNDGEGFPMIHSDSITTFYCWDAAVHFDKKIIRSYCREIARVLRPGGRGFIHHSNLGNKAKKKLSESEHWRSNMTKELFQQFAAENNLEVTKQLDIKWKGEQQETIDCISIFRKPL